MTWIDLYPNAPYAYEYELGQGFTPAQAAGIVGNLIQESGVNPESVQKGGPGRGIAQWSQGGRWDPSLMSGNPSVDLPRQLAKIMQELNAAPGRAPGGYGLVDLRSAQTPEQAAQVFGSEFERYGVEGARVQDATNVYDALALGGAGASAVPASSVPTAVLTSGSANPLTWAGGITQFLVPGSGLLSPVTDSVSGLAAIAGDLGKFLSVIMYGGTWIRFGEAILGVIMLSGGMTLLVGVLASSPGNLTALGSVAALFPGEGTAASLAAKTAAGARAAGGGRTSLAKFAGGARAEGTRQAATKTSREAAASRRRVAEHRAFQGSQTSYRRSLNLYEQAKEREAKADEDRELFESSRGQARANRTGYRRHMGGSTGRPKRDTSDLRRRTP